MLFDQYAFVASTAVKEHSAHPMEDALRIARKELGAESAAADIKFYSGIVPKDVGITTLAQFTKSFIPPVDAVVAVHGETEELVGWYVCLWYNEDDFDDYEEDDED